MTGQTRPLCGACPHGLDLIQPETMKLVGIDIREKTDRVLLNISLVLSELDLGLENVIKTTVFLKDMGDFAGMNEVYAHHFGDHKSARSAIAVRQNPLDALVEIECIAERNSV